MQENLIAGLQKALYLMEKRIELHNKRNNIRSQYTNPVLLKKSLSKWLIVPFLIIIMVVLSTITLSFGAAHSQEILKALVSVISKDDLAYALVVPMDTLTEEEINHIKSVYDNDDARRYFINIFIAFILIIIAIIFCISMLIAVIIRKKVNQYIATQNNKIGVLNDRINMKNQSLMKTETEIIQQIRNVQTAYANEIMPWYPSDYCYIDAAEFFLYSLQNYRADNLKEAINLYEDALHKGRLEQAQQQMLANQEKMVKQQQLGNLLAVGNMVMQAGIQNSINNNTAAINTHSANMQNSINKNTNAINELRNKL